MITLSELNMALRYIKDAKRSIEDYLEIHLTDEDFTFIFNEIMAMSLIIKKESSK